MTAKNEEKQKSEADVLWNQIKKTPIALFGLSSRPLEELVSRVDVMPDKLHLSLKGPSAAVAAIEDSLNVRRDVSGSEVRVNAFNVETANNGMLVISRTSSSK